MTTQKFVALEAPTRNTDGGKYYTFEVEGDANIQRLIAMGYKQSGVFNSKREAEVFAENQPPTRPYSTLN